MSPWYRPKAHQTIALKVLIVSLVVLGASCELSPPTKEYPLPSCRKPSDDLHVAAVKGDLSGIESIIKNGAQVDRIDSLGWTALHWAVVAGRIETVKLLLDRAADTNALDHLGMTPLHWAAVYGRAEFVPLLLSRGARIDSRDYQGKTPLHEAGNREVSKELIRNGAKVDATDMQGRTPLHLARNEGVARSLLEADADITGRTASGQTALQLIVKDEAEAAGLIFYLESPTVRLRGEQARFKIMARNVSICELHDLALVVQSSVAWALVRPRKLPRLAPGEMKTIAIDLQRRPKMPEGKHPIDILIALGVTGVGKMKLFIDTRRIELPSDRGMIRLGNGVLRPASSKGVKYLPFLAIPLIVMAYGFWRRFRQR